MQLTYSRVGRSLAPALLSLILAGGVTAGAAPFTLLGGTPKTLSPASLAAALKTELPHKSDTALHGEELTLGGMVGKVVVR